MKYLTKIRKNIYYTNSPEVSLELEAMGVDKTGEDYKKNDKKTTIGWYYLIKEADIRAIVAELTRRLGFKA